MTSGPSPCSATCKRMPFVSIIRCVTSGIAESTQDVGSGPAALGSAAEALSGSAKAAPTVSAPPAQSMSRRENVASRIVLLPFLSRIWGLDVGVTPDLQVEYTTASRERLFAITSTSYEAELHSQARRARRRGGGPERCPAPQFSESSRGTRGDSVGDQPGSTCTRGARRRGALHTHDPQCRVDRSRR